MDWELSLDVAIVAVGMGIDWDCSELSKGEVSRFIYRLLRSSNVAETDTGEPNPGL
jgi:hypothetical protein